MFDKFFNKAPKTPEHRKTNEAIHLLERLKNEDPSLDIHEAEKALRELVASGAIEEVPEPERQSLDF
jgi:hypothetical protein